METIKELMRKCRSYRRFNEKRSLTKDELWDLIALARLSPSARNAQPLRYILSCDEMTNKAVFPLIAWAGYLKDWDGPEAGERPTGYIVVLKERDVSECSVLFDAGLAVQAILLGAVERGLGGCVIGAYSKEKLRKVLSIPEAYDPLYIIALGEPSEKVVIEPLKDGDVKYWRDEESVHHVPKRDLSDLVL